MKKKYHHKLGMELKILIVWINQSHGLTCPVPLQTCGMYGNLFYTGDSAASTINY